MSVRTVFSTVTGTAIGAAALGAGAYVGIENLPELLDSADQAAATADVGTDAAQAVQQAANAGEVAAPTVTDEDAKTLLEQGKQALDTATATVTEAGEDVGNYLTENADTLGVGAAAGVGGVVGARAGRNAGRNWQDRVNQQRAMKALAQENGIG